MALLPASTGILIKIGAGINIGVVWMKIVEYVRRCVDAFGRFTQSRFLRQEMLRLMGCRIGGRGVNRDCQKEYEPEHTRPPRLKVILERKKAQNQEDRVLQARMPASSGPVAPSSPETSREGAIGLGLAGEGSRNRSKLGG